MIDWDNMTWDQIDERHDQAIVPGGRLIRMLYWVGHDKHYTMCFVPDVAEIVVNPEPPKTIKEKLNERKQANQKKTD